MKLISAIGSFLWWAFGPQVRGQDWEQRSRLRPPILPLIAVLMVAAASPQPTSAGGCHQLFVKQHHVQAVVAYQPLYFAGQATQDEAITRKAIRAELPAIVEAVRQSLQAPIQQQTTGVLGAKCGRCHTGDSAKGDVNFSRTINAEAFRRCIELLGTGRDTPAAMKGVLASLTPAEKGAITEELLNLTARPAPVKPEPQVTIPDPTDEPGVIR